MNLYLKDLNFCYVVYNNDKYQFIEYIADTRKELADCLHLTESGLSHLIKRNIYRSNLKIEKVQIADYCFVVYKKGIISLENIVFISRSFDYLSKKFKITNALMSEILKFFFYPHTYKLRINCKKQCYKINERYGIGLIDLLDLDNIALQNIENIMLNGKIEELDF